MLHDVTPAETALIVAALRAYAGNGPMRSLLAHQAACNALAAKVETTPSRKGAETIQIIPVAAAIADHLGRINLEALATIAGVPLLADADSEFHSGRLYWPGRDQYRDNDARRLADMREILTAPRGTSRACKAFVRAILEG